MIVRLPEKVRLISLPDGGIGLEGPLLKCLAVRDYLVAEPPPERSRSAPVIPSRPRPAREKSTSGKKRPRTILPPVGYLTTAMIGDEMGLAAPTIAFYITTKRLPAIQKMGSNGRPRFLVKKNDSQVFQQWYRRTRDERAR